MIVLHDLTTLIALMNATLRFMFYISVILSDYAFSLEFIDTLNGYFSLYN